MNQHYYYYYYDMKAAALFTSICQKNTSRYFFIKYYTMYEVKPTNNKNTLSRKSYQD